MWAEGPTRQSVFRALQARRTYAATAKIELSVRGGERWMGERIEAQSQSPMTLTARGTAPIRVVELVVDGEVVESRTPSETEVRWQVDRRFTPGQYFYFHLIQSDGNQAWSSPVWIID